MTMNFEQMCRVCLASNKTAYDIYTSYYLKRNTIYAEMLSCCTKLKPYTEDGLPRLICKDCSRQLKRTYAFNIRCEESDRKLRCYLENKSDLDTTRNSVMKYEDANGLVKDETEVKDENVKDEVDDIKSSKLQGDVKIEPEDDAGNDSCWDADDDNVLLEDIKTNKKKDLNNWDAENDSMFYDIEKSSKNIGTKIEVLPKKKRGRKKKVYLDGELKSVPDSKLPHQCDTCGKFLSTKSNLKAHKLSHTDLRPYKCPVCPATFRSHSARFQHKKVHTGETPYHCEYCPKRFSRRTGLVNHIRMHTGEKLFSCDVCLKTFVQSAQLSIHMKRHKGDKPYLCQVCGKGFPIKSDLKVHQRVHNGEKPYSCHLCTKTFATSGNLSIHIRIHNKEIRYNCKECQRGFVTCSAYNVHIKRHKGQRDYQCECGKTFYTSSALKQHKVVHTGEKKYQCKICDRKFSQTSHLSRHFKRDHAKPNVPVPPSDHYKTVVENRSVIGLFNVQNLAESVKCEGS